MSKFAKPIFDEQRLVRSRSIPRLRVLRSGILSTLAKSDRRSIVSRFGLLMSAVACVLFLGAARPAYATVDMTFQGLVRTLVGNATVNHPSALVVDSAGNVYIADAGNNQIVEVSAQGTASALTISGLTPALSSPAEIAIDGSGNLYVADMGNNRVVEVSASGAGSVINLGSVTLSSPQGIAVDQSGNIFIADTGNNRIVEVPSGGSAAALSIAVSSGASTLRSPIGLAVNVSGTLYIADSGSSHNRIVTVAAGSTTGVVLSINTSQLGCTNTLSSPAGVAVDPLGDVYITDTGHGRIVEVNTGGTAFALSTPSFSLDLPKGVALDVFGAVYIADTGNSRALVVNPPVNVTSFAEVFGTSLNKSAVGFGHVQLGASGGITLTLPFQVAFNGTLGNPAVQALTSGTASLDFTLGANTTCAPGTNDEDCSVQITFLPTAPGLRMGAVVLYDDSSPQNQVLTIPLYGWGDSPVAALAPNTGSVISTGGVATNYPFQLALDGAGNMYVGNYVQDGSSPKVVKIPAGGGTATVVSTSPVTLGTSITGVALDGAGNLFIADYYDSQIVVVTPGGAASILSITGLSPALGQPTALAFDAAGNLYIGDYAASGRSSSRVVEVSSLLVAGSTSTGIGTVVSTGSYTFSSSTITGVAVGPNGTVYIAARTSNGSNIVQVTEAGVASILNATGITFIDPQGVFVDGMGNVYVEDPGNTQNGSSPIVRITMDGVVSVLNISGLTSPSTLAAGYGITTDSSGNLYIPDWNNSRIVFANVSGGALTFPTGTKQGTADSTDDPMTATVTNLGNQPLVFSTNPTYTADFTNNPSDANLCTSSTSLSSGTDCDVSVDFTPQSVGSVSAGITVTDNTLNVSGSTQQVSVSGTGLTPGDTTSTGVSISPTSLINGQTATITATVTDTTAGDTSNIPTGTVTFTDTVGATITTLNGGSSVNLSAGKAILTGVLLSGIGTHTINAVYAGISESYLTSTGSNTVALSKAPVTVTGPATQPVPVTHGQTGSAAISITGPYTTIPVPSGSLTYNILNASSTNVASGTLTLTLGATSSAAAVPIPNTLAAGSYAVSATYSGDANYLATSTAATIQVQVSQITSTVSWSQPSAITYGATLSGILNASALTGTSAIPGSFAYTATPSGGSASTVTSATILAAGSYTLIAAFTPADTTTYTSATSNVSLIVNKATPTAVLVSSVNPSVLANAVTFTATVASTAGTPSGSVSFYDGTTLLGSAVTLAEGTAAYTTSSLAVGLHSITAAYSSDNNFLSVTSSAVAQTVGKATPTVVVISSVNPVLVTNAVTFTATVSSTAGNPSGSVSFYDGTTLLGSAVTLAQGTAAYTTSSLAVGPQSITAVYSGDANFSSVTSSAVAQVVQNFSLTVPTSSSSSSSASGGSASGTSGSATVAPGGTATYTLALGPSGGTTFPLPVTYTVSGLPPGATATITPPTLPAGSPLTNITLTILVPSQIAALHPTNPLGRGLALALVGGMFLLPFGRKMRPSSGKAGRFACLLLLALAATSATLGLTSCGGTNSGYFGQQVNTYTVTVTATCGNLSHSTTVNLTVK
ncbi:MAG: Ig-like domain repeat protein [Terriglobia bacterium]